MEKEQIEHYVQQLLEKSDLEVYKLQTTLLTKRLDEALERLRVIEAQLGINRQRPPGPPKT